MGKDSEEYNWHHFKGRIWSIVDKQKERAYIYLSGKYWGKFSKFIQKLQLATGEQFTLEDLKGGIFNWKC